MSIPAETVPEGHNITHHGFSLAYTLNNKRPRVVYRSKHTEGKTYHGSTELQNGTWSPPIAITELDSNEINAECLALVMSDDGEFIFSIHEGKLRRRSKTRIGGFTENQNLTINGTVNISSLFIAASLSGQDNSTIYVYCWNDDHKLVEVAGSGNVWTAKPVTNIVAKHSKKLAVTRTKDGLSLVFMNVHDKINFVSRNAAGVWSEAKEIETKVHQNSPLAIIPIPAPVIPENLKKQLSTAPPATTVPGYPVPALPEVPPKVILVPNQPGFALAFVDKHRTAHIHVLDQDGSTDGLPCYRIGRLNPQPFNNDDKHIPCLGLIPGVEPRKVTALAISSLHGSPTLLSYPCVTPQAYIIDAAEKSVLFESALARFQARFKRFDDSSKALKTTDDTTKKEGLTEEEHLRLVAARDHAGIIFYTAYHAWKSACKVASDAHSVAITAYQKAVTAHGTSELVAIKTEARQLNDRGEPVLPPPPTFTEPE